MAIVRFEPNVPVECALKYDGGKRVTSKIPGAKDQMMYTICGGDVLYVPLEVGEQIDKLGIRREELMSICRRQQNGVTRWTVERLSDAAEPQDLAPALEKSIEHVQREQRATTSKSQPAAAPSATQMSGDQPHNLTVASKLVASALIAAIDGLIVAAEYAKKRGIKVSLDLDFNAEDVRCLASTTYIQACKSPLFEPEPKANGGTAWPH